MTPGQFIKIQRTAIGMTQLELAKKLDYEIPQFISLMENGHSKVPIDKCSKIAKALKMSNSVTREFAESLVKEYRTSVYEKFGFIFGVKKTKIGSVV